MTKQEAQEYLNSMLIPFSENKESNKVKDALTSAEEDELLQIVVGFKAWSEQIEAQNKKIEAQNKKIEIQNKKMRESVQNFEIEKLKRKIEKSKAEIEKSKAEIEELKGKIGCQKTLGDVAVIMKGYVKLAQTTNGGTKIPVQPSAMPFLIKQVLFFIMVSYIEYELPYTQKDILKLLRVQYGVNISHNFFSRMKTTPTQYCNMMKYQQPELPINYQGQKHEELAVAIKNLVYQAGKYDVFCDVFGGSGAALLAVDRRKDSKYVYNELHRCLYNLFVVMADSEKHKEMIQELEALIRCLRDGESWLDEDMLIQKARDYVTTKDYREVDSLTLSDDVEDVDISFNEVVNFMMYCRGYVELDGVMDTFDFDGKTYTKQELLDTVFYDDPLSGGTDSSSTHMKGARCFFSFFENHSLVIAIAKELPNALRRFKMTDSNGKQINADNVYDRYMRVRFYEYYAYFIELLNKKGRIAPSEAVRYAVAEVFYQSLRAGGVPDFAAVRQMILDGRVGIRAVNSSHNLVEDAHEFLKKNFKRIIIDVYKRNKYTICENMDSINLIYEYRSGGTATKIKHKNPLFYVDPPYLETSGYKDVVNGVSAFTPKNMQNLIEALEKSSDKFIFSCRAVKSKDKGIADKKTRAANRRIKANVFEVFNKEFIDKGRPLWVLAIEENGSLGNLIKKNDVVELMICNFEICNFVDKDYNNIGFKVYTYQDFLQIWDANAAV